MTAPRYTVALDMIAASALTGFVAAGCIILPLLVPHRPLIDVVQVAIGIGLLWLAVDLASEAFEPVRRIGAAHREAAAERATHVAWEAELPRNLSTDRRDDT